MSDVYLRNNQLENKGSKYLQIMYLIRYYYAQYTELLKLNHKQETQFENGRRSLMNISPNKIYK